MTRTFTFNARFETWRRVAVSVLADFARAAA